jgi:hypothetical protein
VTLTITRRELSSLRHYPGNARRGDVEAIASSLAANGQYRPLVVQQSTGFVLTGNHTMDAAALACVHCPHTLSEHEDVDHQNLCPAGCPGFAPHTALDVTVLDVDDDAARRIVLADNRTSDLGGYDDRALLTLLREVGEDLGGTGYDLDDYDDLLAALEEADAANPPQDDGELRPYAGAKEGSAYGEGGEGEGRNIRTTPSYAEYQNSYASRASRFMALIYPLPQYEWMVAKLEAIAAELSCDNNAETVLRLVELHTGEPSPALAEGERIGGSANGMGAALPEEAPAQ